jgi:hypothetical protein
MTLTHNESSVELTKLAPGDAETLSSVVSRSQIMRFWPPKRSSAELSEWLGNGSVSAWLNHSLESGYGIGMVAISHATLDGSSERVLSYAFDRCIDGRDWALRSIRALAETEDLRGTVVLIGPSMTNSERVAKALGYVFEREITLDEVGYRLMRFAD